MVIPMGAKPRRLPNPMHLAGSGERYTPDWLLDRARYVLGGIDLDPASTKKANSLVQARRYFTAEQDGLSRPWQAGTMWLNAPGSCPRQGSGVFTECDNRDRCSCGLVRKFWEKMVAAYSNRAVTSGLWLGFNIGQLQTLQGQGPSPLSYLTCILGDRVRYLDGDFVELAQPPHASYITLLSAVAGVEHRFRSAFMDKGVIISTAVPC